MNAEQYRKENKKLHEEYEKKVRAWLSEFGNEELARNIPYFRDGVTCPETWFRAGNTFRPLIILKEVSLGFDDVEKLPDYLKTWGNLKCFDFVENPFDDVKVGYFKQWRRIARLAKGLEEIQIKGWFGKCVF